MTETHRNYQGCICEDEYGSVGIVSHMITNCPGHLPWAGVDLFTGGGWESFHPHVIAEDIDTWVKIRQEELLSNFQLQHEIDHPTRNNLLT